MTKEQIIIEAKKAIQAEGKAVCNMGDLIGDHFYKACQTMMECKGKIIITGVGKSGHIGAKIAATLSSTGTPAFFMNPNEGIHGDLGVIMDIDCLIAISKTGETEELLSILNHPKRIGVPIISITENPDSSLAEISDVLLLIPKEDEVCPINLAPTTSTTMTLVMGDALAVALMSMRNFSREQFAIYHPGGSLGKRLMKVEQIMTPLKNIALMDEETSVKEALLRMDSINSQHSRGVCLFYNKNKQISGILADGDLKRLLIKYENLIQKKACEIMIKSPKKIGKDRLVVEALQIMENKYHFLLVENDKGEIIGVIHIHDILKGKIV